MRRPMRLMEHIDIALADFSRKFELIALWAEAFGDDEAFIASFLERYMIPDRNAPAAILGGRVVSALYLLDFPLYSKGKALGECAYLFAAATKEGYKNRGYMSALLGYAADLCRNRGQKAIFLFPQGQDPKLFDFYSRFGYKNIYAAKKITKRGEGKAAGPFRLAEKDITDPAVFGQLYEAYAGFAAGQPLIPKKDELFYFECAASYLDVGENSGRSAHFAVLERVNEQNSEKICYVFYKKYKNNYYIDDIILYRGQDNFEEAADILADFFFDPDAGFEINIPPVSHSDEKNTNLAMILPLSGEVEDIIGGLEAPVYINMFMNI